jgi:hypothetical protein
MPVFVKNGGTKPESLKFNKYTVADMTPETTTQVWTALVLKL